MARRISSTKAKPAPLLTIRVRKPYPGGVLRMSYLSLSIAGRDYLWIAHNLDRGEWMAITTLVGLPDADGRGDASLHTDARHAEDAAREVLRHLDFGARA